MAHGKLIHLYLFDGLGYLFDPLQANTVKDRLDLVRQNYYTLRVQAVKKTDFAMQSDLTAPNAATVDLSQYEDIIFGLKTAIADADYDAAWRGYNTGDSAWHNLSYGRLSIDIAPTTALSVARYRGVFRLLDGTSYYDLPDLGLYVDLRQNIVVGTEPSTPSGGLGTQSYTGTVLAGASTVAITVTGMTTGGTAIPYFYGSAPTSTISATCTTDTVTVTLGGPADVDTAVAVYIVAKA